MMCGVGAVAVESGSMEPELPVGSLAIVQEQDGYAEGDVVAYASPSGALVTHRIRGFDGQGRAIARGDANNVDDPAFDPSLIEGRVVACVPLAGALAQSLRTPAGAAALLLVAAAALLFGRGARGGPASRKGRRPEDAFEETARLEG